MVYLGDLNLVSGSKYQVYFEHDCPYDKVNGLGKAESELKKSGVLVDSMPIPAPPAGQYVSGTFVDKTTKEVTYEYADMPTTA